MRITELDAYKKFEEKFKNNAYSQGNKDYMTILDCGEVEIFSEKLLPVHYVYGINYGTMKFEDVPENCRTREFFLHTLSGANRDVLEYVKANLDKFDKRFFKDHIATNSDALKFEFNDFEYMPLEYIDEELVSCAMLKVVDSQYMKKGRYTDNEAFFFSVYRRKPDILTEEMYVLGACCFAVNRYGKNRFLDITPEEFKTKEYYFALCQNNSTPVMEHIPENMLTTEFILDLLIDNPDNIRAFSEDVLERKAYLADEKGLKIWQDLIIKDAYQIKNIPLNDERVRFFLSIYNENSFEYKHFFKEHYDRYLRNLETH